MIEGIDVQLLDLLIQALEIEKERGAKRVYRYHALAVCRDCLHAYIVDYMGMSFSSQRQCSLCGESFPYPIYEVLVCESTKRRAF